MRVDGDEKCGDKTKWESKTPLHLDYLCLNFFAIPPADPPRGGPELSSVGLAPKAWKGGHAGVEEANLSTTDRKDECLRLVETFLCYETDAKTL